MVTKYKFKSKKSLAANALVVLFSLISVISLAFNFFKHGGITGFNLISNKHGINDFMGWTIDIYLSIGMVLALVVLVTAIVNYFVNIKFFDKIKINLLSVFMIILGAGMIYLAAKAFIDSSAIRSKDLLVSGSMSVGWVSLILSTSWTTAAAIGTQFFNK